MKNKTPYLVAMPGRAALHIRDGKIRISTKTADRAEATAVLMKYIADGGSSKNAPPSDSVTDVGGMLDLWAAKHKATAPDSWKRSFQYVIRRLKRIAGHKIPDQIDLDWSREYKKIRIADGSGNAAVRKELQTLRAAWKMCYAEKKTSVPMPYVEMPPAGEPREAYLTKDQARQLLDACHLPHLRVFIRLGFATGGRPGAIMALPWSRVDFDVQQLDLRLDVWVGGERVGTRVRKKRASRVPFDDDLLADLKSARAVATTDYVVEFAGLPIKSVRRSFQAAVIAAGLDPDEITPYILRHSAATWMAQAGVDLFQIAGFLGHTSTRMVEKVYGHHHPDYLKGAMRATSLK